MSESWHSQGYDGIDKEEARIQASKVANRLWIRGGSGKDLVLIDDVPFCIKEHNAKVNGSWRNHHTCMENVSEEACHSCETLGERSRAFTGYLTTVDCSLSVDRKGNKYQFEVMLVGGKLSQLKKWKRKKEDKGSLVMTKWKVHREDDQKPSTGDEWEFDGEVKSQEKLFEVANYRGKLLSELWDDAEKDPKKMEILKKTFQVETDENGKLVRRVVPINYMEQLKPRGNKYIKDLLRGVDPDEATGRSGTSAGGSSGSSGGDEGKEDPVPF